MARPGKAKAYWTVEYLDPEHAVRTSGSGQLTMVLAIQKAGESLREAAHRGTDNLLVDDLDLQPRLTTQEMYRLPAMLEPLGLKRGAKVAVVYARARPSASDFEFMETVAINQGFNVRLFDTEEDARKWLQQAD